MWAPCGWVSLRLGFIHAEIFGPCGAQVEKVWEAIAVHLL